MPADSLVNMSLRSCCKMHKHIRDIGILPYSIARPVLLKVDNPEQLRALEERCPQIIGHDAEIWLALIKRDIPDWETKRHEPADPKNWWKVYRKLKQESIKEMDAGVDQLKAALSGKNEKQLAEIKPMKAAANALARRTAAQTRYAHQTGRTGPRSSGTMSVIDKLKKESRDAKIARELAEEKQRKRMATTVTRAPAQFVQDVKARLQQKQQSSETSTNNCRPATATRRPDAPLTTPARKVLPPTSRPVPSISSSPPSVSRTTFQEREARLRALTSGKPLPATNTPNTSAKEALPSKEPPTTSVEAPSPSTPEKPNTLSASFLEERTPPPTARKLLRPSLSPPKSGMISRSASPGLAPLVRKRKKEADIFMAPVKRRVVVAGGGAVNAPLL